MKVVKETVYIAKDGARFTTESLCREYEEECEKARKVMSLLGPKVKEPNGQSCGFGNGEYFRQHDPVKVFRFRVALIDALRCGPLKRAMMEREAKNPSTDWKTAHPSWFVGQLDGAYSGPWYDLASRLCNIDSQGREWGQPYFTRNPNPKAKAI